MKNDITRILKQKKNNHMAFNTIIRLKFEINDLASFYNLNIFDFSRAVQKIESFKIKKIFIH